jgi:hypothetical protein
MPGVADAAAVEAAEALALTAVQFLASEPDRLQRFLDLTGLQPDRLRARLTDQGFLAGVLDHLLGDEALLTEFADWAALQPTAVGQARRALGGWRPDIDD